MQHSYFNRTLPFVWLKKTPKNTTTTTTNDDDDDDNNNNNNNNINNNTFADPKSVLAVTLNFYNVYLYFCFLQVISASVT